MRIAYYAGWLTIASGVASLAGAFVVGFPLIGAITAVGLIGSGVFMIWLSAGWDKPLGNASELYKYGRPANATVRKVEEQKLDGNGGRTAKLTVHVTPRNESKYTTTRTVALPGGKLPAVGDTVTIKFDPRSRKNFVLLEESYQVQDQIQSMLGQPFFQGTPQG